MDQQQAGSSSGAEHRIEADDDSMEPVFIGDEDGEVVADLDEEVGKGGGGLGEGGRPGREAGERGGRGGGGGMTYPQSW